CQREKQLFYGDGNQSRDFTYVKDMVRATILAGKTEECGVYNVGYGKQISIKLLLQFVATFLHAHVDFELKPVRDGDVTDSLANISRAQKYLGYSPQWDVYEGLKDMLPLLP
ncbi:unnamed protein product, partial [marine sediment metagenome]